MDDTAILFDADANLVAKFIGRLSPEPICDSCIADRLDILKDAAARAAHGLAGLGGFERSKAACSLCGETRMTTRRR
jgi:hypothetical protein